MRRPPPPDGYEWTGKGMEIRLVDPVTCPGGHPVGRLRRGHRPCVEHHGHPEWTCGTCGRSIWWFGGRFVDELDCR